MIKLTFCLRRLPHLSREEFQTYWRETHAPLVKKHAETLRILRYVQVHTGFEGMNEAMRGLRGGPGAYDGVAEIWFESQAAMAANASEAARNAGLELLEDEKKFIDLEKSPLFMGTEDNVI